MHDRRARAGSDLRLGSSYDAFPQLYGHMKAAWLSRVKA